MMIENPLLSGMQHVEARINDYRLRARHFYYRVVLSRHDCPRCGGRLVSTGPSRACCVRCAGEIDPTVHFQRSGCCDARLAFKRTRYACAHCGQIIRSEFLFDEHLIDPEYFREKMSEWRERKRRQRDELRLFLAVSRSKDLDLAEIPDGGSLRGLLETLDEFVGGEQTHDVRPLHDEAAYRLEDYRKLILSRLADAVFRFDAFPTIIENRRLDRVRRFTTLIFMEQFREIRLEQRGEDIWVMPYEADLEG